MQNQTPTNSPVSDFLRHHYRHFNAATLIDAADAYRAHLDGGGQMMITLAGAMSTAELGLSLAEMIRADKVHCITCTGANLEEDIFNLVAHDFYVRVPHYRELSAQDEVDLRARDLYRVTDTCIPEDEAMKRIENRMIDLWNAANASGERLFPHEFFYRLLDQPGFADLFQIDPKNSWMLAAKEKNLPIFVPGWEDSTLGNMFAAHCIRGEAAPSVVKGGIEYMIELADYYTRTTTDKQLGFFQIGGGIAGDFPICVVPMLHLDLKRMEAPVWGYFCQISDSTTSYGSYSGAVPNEKITWDKLKPETPKFVIESDATIVAPLVFALVLGM